jgi:hypothetical protein
MLRAADLLHMKSNFSWDASGETVADLVFNLNVTSWNLHFVQSYKPNIVSPHPEESMLHYLCRIMDDVRFQCATQSPKTVWSYISPESENKDAKSRENCEPILIDNAAIQDVHDVLFDHNGCLRRDLRRTIDFGDKHGVIQLSINKKKDPTRRDFRWILPITQFPDDEKYSSNISVYSRLRSILKNAKLFDDEQEIIEDLSLILGGTTHQYLHCDYSPLQKSKKSDDKSNSIRPASLLLGLGGKERPVRLAIPKTELMEELEVEGR